jgi:hypothetical protein
LLVAETAVEHEEFMVTAALAEHGDADTVFTGREAETGSVGAGVLRVGGDDEVLDERFIDQNGDACGAGVHAIEIDRFFAALANESAAGLGGEGVKTHELVAQSEDGKFVGDIVFFERKELDPPITAVAERVAANLGKAGRDTLQPTLAGLGDDGLVEGLVGGRDRRL